MSHRGTSPRASALRAVTFAVSCAAVLALATPSAASAITRAEVLARGERWIAAKTPYSQSRFARLDGSLVATSVSSASRVGYRTDCSGFVSMSLGLTTTSGRPLSLSTATLDDVMRRITKDELMPGDVILRPNDLVISGKRVSYGHAVIFAGWVDETRTRYVAYHQSSGQRGAVRGEVNWGTSGFWSERGFAPYRCMLVSERTKIGTAAGE